MYRSSGDGQDELIAGLRGFIQVEIEAAFQLDPVTFVLEDDVRHPAVQVARACRPAPTQDRTSKFTR